MNSGCHGFNIDVAFKSQIFVHFFLWFVFIFIFLLFLGCIFLYFICIFFVPRYVTTYICMSGVCNFFCLKVTSAIKHRNTAEEIISYAHRVYSLLLKLWKKQSIIFLLSLYHAARLQTPTSLLICVQFIPQWEATQIWWLWLRHEHQAKFREFIFEEMFQFFRL